MIIYKATNSTNGKCYIGQTTQSFVQRKREHFCRLFRGDRDHKFYQALKKYGWDSFSWDILETCKTLDMLVDREQYYISLFNSYNRGYNCNPGGTVVSEETRRKIVDALTGRKIHWGWKIKASRIANGTYGGNYGAKGDKSSLAKSFKVITPAGEQLVITGLRAFCREHKLTHALMFAVARGEQTHHKGYKCYRFEEPSTTRPGGRTLKRVEMGNISKR